FLFLLSLSLMLTVRSHSFHRSKFFNSANWVSGIVYNSRDNITSYFKLKEENSLLLEENNKLRHLLFNRNFSDSVALDSAEVGYEVLAARIIKNSYANSENYLTINKGSAHGVSQDMGVITSTGILGIVEHSTKNYAAIQSVLNTNSNINAKIKNTNHFGSLTWNTDHFDVVQLEDIPRLVTLTVGDTIITGAMSSIFPEGIPIGVVNDFKLETSASFYTINVGLFNDMTNLSTAYVITNLSKPEIEELESNILDEQD
ncbi:MAG: rod shape-determining protein MreC, partial [Flavobacteriaceae bacterium]|nr:rod shape-determining protein MreC [Flavobacteriaceae bacterium]